MPYSSGDLLGCCLEAALGQDHIGAPLGDLGPLWGRYEMAANIELVVVQMNSLPCPKCWQSTVAEMDLCGRMWHTCTGASDMCDHKHIRESQNSEAGVRVGKIESQSANCGQNRSRAR